jgi:hypothetical protein
MFASGVMLVSVIGALWSLQKAKTRYGTAIGPRHIQFVSVCLIVPTILILGLEKVLTSETTATLIGGLAGYLLSNLGKYEPTKPDTGRGGTGNDKPDPPADGGTGEGPQNEPLPDNPAELEIQIARAEAQKQLVEEHLRQLRAHQPKDPIKKPVV